MGINVPVAGVSGFDVPFAVMLALIVVRLPGDVVVVVVVVPAEVVVAKVGALVPGGVRVVPGVDGVLDPFEADVPGALVPVEAVLAVLVAPLVVELARSFDRAPSVLAPPWAAVPPATVWPRADDEPVRPVPLVLATAFAPVPFRPLALLFADPLPDLCPVIE